MKLKKIIKRLEEIESLDSLKEFVEELKSNTVFYTVKVLDNKTKENTEYKVTGFPIGDYLAIRKFKEDPEELIQKTGETKGYSIDHIPSCKRLKKVSTKKKAILFAEFIRIVSEKLDTKKPRIQFRYANSAQDYQLYFNSEKKVLSWKEFTVRGYPELFSKEERDKYNGRRT